MTKRSIRIANCSGAYMDPGDHMYNQAFYGPVDVIYGDYLAELNLAANAVSYHQGQNPGWVATAWDGITKTIDLLAEKKIKLVINGGSLNPRGLAEKTNLLAQEKRLSLRVAYIEGDDLLSRAQELLPSVKHFDSDNKAVKLPANATSFLDKNGRSRKPLVAANAYLGMRAIRKALDVGADIVICGRVSDASPVMGAAAWWHGWDETKDYDELAGALVAGHLIECSTYVTGANFAGFAKYDLKNDFNDMALPIAEIAADGTATITKHKAIEHGFVTADTVKCQLLYELQGNLYLNSDVAADLTNIEIHQEGPEKENRVRVTGIVGHAPPPTTKLAIFYQDGFQVELLVNATGYQTPEKYVVQESQLRWTLAKWGVLDKLSLLDFQRVGVPEENPSSQLAATTYLRIFCQADEVEPIHKVREAMLYNGMTHFPGFNGSMNYLAKDTAMPYLGFYPALVPQTELVDEAAVILSNDSKVEARYKVGPPVRTKPVGPRASYETSNPVDLASFGPTKAVPLGDLVLARSGDKGANINVGFFVHTDEQWDWLRSFLTCEVLKKLMGDDWQPQFHVERVEFPLIRAVHFVIYGPLERGVSSSRRLDMLAKGFAEFIRAVHVPIPEKFL